MTDKKSLSFKKIKKIYHEQVKVEPLVVEIKVEPQVVLPEPVSIVEEKPVEPPKVEIIKGTENLVNEFLSVFGAQDLVELVPTTKAPIKKIDIPPSAFVDSAKLDDFLKSIQEKEVVSTPIVEQAPSLEAPSELTKKVLDLTKPKVKSNGVKVDPNIKAIHDRLNIFEKRFNTVIGNPGGGETHFLGLDDIDHGSIGAGKFLTYDEITRKFTFVPISGDGSGITQIQSNWTQTNTSALDYIKNKPSLFSGSYNDLTDKPTIPTVPTTLSSLTNDSGYLTAVSWNDVSGKPSLFSGSYTDLTNKPTIPTVPTNVSAFTNDANYVVSSELASFVNNSSLQTTLGDYASKSYVSALGYATESFVNTAITNLIGAAPDALNTLKEIADQLAADESALSSLTNTVAGKVSLTGSYANPTWITSLAYGKLTGAPTNVSAFTNDSGYLSSVSWSQVTGKPDAILTLNDVNVISNDMLVNKSITIGSTAVALGASITTLTGLTGVTSNSATAFIAGAAAESNVALQMPRESALRNPTNGFNNMYFDVSNGGSAHGQFQFRSSNGYTNVLTMSPTGVTFNTGATFTSRTPSVARTGFNSAIDSEIIVDEMRFRISNQGGIFPQVIGHGSSRNLAWTGVGAISGTAVTQVGSTGTIVASNAWTTLYNAHGMDSPGDTITVTLQDKAGSRIYRVTFMRSDNGSTTGYNIIAERLL